jgi:hypothetical protein
LLLILAKKFLARILDPAFAPHSVLLQIVLGCFNVLFKITRSECGGSSVWIANFQTKKIVWKLANKHLIFMGKFGKMISIN